MGEGIWIFAEHDGDGVKRVTLELLSDGQRLARRFGEPLCVCLLGHDVGDNTKTFSEYGVDKIYLLDHKLLSTYDLEAYCEVLSGLIGEYAPSLVMLEDTPIGSELAPRVAARLRLPCVMEAKKIAGSTEALQITKAVFNDQVYATVAPRSASSVVVTVTPGDTDVMKSDEQKQPEIVRVPVRLTESTIRTRCRKFTQGDPRTMRLEEADMVVAVGRGAGTEGLPLLQELADAIGASIGGSRAAVDSGILPYERQIGISGKTIAPKFLIACGISGANQFTVGMESSNFVVAVNKDPKARIFEFADLSIKGDLHEVVPAVVELLKQKGWTPKATNEAD